MAYGFNPASLFMPEEPALPQFLTPEEMQQQAIAERFNANRGGGFVPAMMGALDYMRTAMPAQAPTPRTVSGGSVIGLMPEQTNALLNRVNEANMLDQRMFEARQGEMRADSRAREGRILSAREAQARRQQELAIEKQRMDMQERKEAAERARPKFTPVAENPGLLYRQSMGADGNPVVEIVQAGGAAIPAESAKPVRGMAVNGKLVNPYTAEVMGDLPAEQFKASPSEQARVIEMLNKSNLSEAEKADTYGMFLKTGELPNVEFEEKDTGFTNITRTLEDGSKVIQRVPTESLAGEGMQVAPPKADKDKDPFDYLKKTFGTNWAKGNKQTMANALGQAGFAVEQIKQALGPEVDEDGGWFWFDKQNYTPPAGTAAPAAPALDAVGTATTRTLKDGTTVKVKKMPDGTYQEVE